MLVHFINMKFNGDLREETFKILGDAANLLI